MNCLKCSNSEEELTNLTKYGMLKLGTNDNGEYCSKCFIEKFPELHDKEISCE